MLSTQARSAFVSTSEGRATFGLAICSDWHFAGWAFVSVKKIAVNGKNLHWYLLGAYLNNFNLQYVNPVLSSMKYSMRHNRFILFANFIKDYIFFNETSSKVFAT